MNNLTDMYYLLQLIIRNVFAFLRDILIKELPRLLTSTIKVENIENSKIRTPSAIKHVTADFAAFFIICAFLGVLVFLSAKCTKEDEDNRFSHKRTETISADFPDDPIYHLPRSLITKAIKYYHDRGDEYFSEEGESPRRDNYIYEHDYSHRKNLSTSSIFANQSDNNSQYSESTQKGWRNLKKVNKSQHWLIRKTRSGHVYGKYPI
ncbi:uncharacterized protein LOC117171490 [Belonocnema kinseyi]|uniref:uncharacterized protein LOC117171490 n=1 Tax=Belonocnema kinseyi TaxID=2817044 RepID=UPI00143DE23D|nr:uncharacterized protein LOC117171490 [Belonocnema kinseyi]